MSKTRNLECCAAEYRDRVFFHIKKYLAARTARLPKPFAAQVSDYPDRRGKALRPVLLMLYSRASGASGRSAEKTAAAYQLLEDWGLGRDDLLDNSPLRRGEPSLHVRYGLAPALNALDLLHVYVFDMLYSYCGLGPALYARIHRLFREASEVTLTGQYMDLLSRRTPPADFTARDYFRIVTAKTAYYTCVYPCLIGAAIAGHGGGENRIKEFGLKLGAAFQLRDDILDIENSGRGAFGKVPGNDIYEGKRTLVLYELLRRANPARARRITAVYAKPQGTRTREDADMVRELMLRTGALDAARAEFRVLAGAARRIFEARLAPRLKQPYAGLLGEFIAALENRPY